MEPVALLAKIGFFFMAGAICNLLANGDFSGLITMPIAIVLLAGLTKKITKK